MITINTGLVDPVLELIPDWFHDGTSAETKEEKVQAYAYHLIGAMRNPAKVDTVRKHILANWQFVRVLADMHPSVFDEFWTTYAERVLGPE